MVLPPFHNSCRGLVYFELKPWQYLLNEGSTRSGLSVQDIMKVFGESQADEKTSDIGEPQVEWRRHHSQWLVWSARSLVQDHDPLLRTLAPITVDQVHSASRMKGRNGRLDKKKRAIGDEDLKIISNELNRTGRPFWQERRYKQLRHRNFHTTQQSIFNQKLPHHLPVSTKRKRLLIIVFLPSKATDQIILHLSPVLVLLENENMPMLCLNINSSTR